MLPGLTGSALGVIDTMTAAAGKLSVSGWAYDPDTAASTKVALYVDGRGIMFDANQVRPDFAVAYPGYGANHGYSWSMNITPGPHEICLYAIDIAGQGSNRLIACRTITAHSGSPYGAVDAFSVRPGMYTVSGWVFDPDTIASTPVHVYAGASGVAGTAEMSRSDVAAAYPGYGPNHGFSLTVPASPGMNNVCVYGIDVVAPGANKQIACKQLVGMSGAPVGVVDSVTVANGNITVTGWAYDPDTQQPIDVHVYVDSSGRAFTADLARPDVGAAYPAYGAKHGFSARVPASSGEHNVCVYAINVGPGENHLLSCRSIKV
jgi:hypothetical protein